MPTFAELVEARAHDEHAGLRFEDETYSWARVVLEARKRAALALALRDPGRPFHVGVLLDNVPEYVFWIFGAALAGAAVVGVNPTRRGAELAADIRHTDSLFLVTDSTLAGLLDGMDLGVPLLLADSPDYRTSLASREGASRTVPGSEPLLLLFTSGSTGAPKAVICSQERLAEIAAHGVVFGIGPDAVTYIAMPLFHGNAVMANLAMATHGGATVALRRRFSASGFLPDIRKFGVTYFNYVGRALAYILATPERQDDAENTLAAAFGTEASARDMAEFGRRFGCHIIEGYGSSEGVIAISKTPGTPPDALGLAGEGVDLAVHDPETGLECPRAVFDGARRLVNAHDAIGEIVRRGATFEGYYNNPEADARRLRDGWYWSGDLGYRDQDGYFYFAGRDADWLRVDGENFAAAPVERILARYPPVIMCAVYAVPDARTGDQVMATLELSGSFDPDGFARFLAEQPDLGTKWAPRFVRITREMPLTPTNKVAKTGLRRERWECADPVFWRPGRESRYLPMAGADRAELRKRFSESGREQFLL
ncbi:AMP-binding protein [Sphaerisporangium viridialbum]|uniref:AMP-binding protein n=1 Tax=Sphaerisporangium viridialbum TaxID=46189 RepID=UPI003C7259D7